MDPEQRHAQLRALPSVDRLAAQLAADASATSAEAAAVARHVLARRRAELLAAPETPETPETPGTLGGSGTAGGSGTPDVSNPDTTAADLLARARAALSPGPRRVLNGTGVILHTNLGRAPLAPSAARAAARAAEGYLDLEYDLGSGRRGQRDAHVVELLRELTGAEDATVVNNGAAATLLAAAALAGPGRRIVVSRGQLVEIGGGFRIPEVVASAGAQLVEVGTTNRTRLSDYRAAVAAGAEVILRVHPSNFRTLGFVEEVAVGELTGLGVPVIDDLGSGVLATGPRVVLEDEPAVRESVAAGAAVVCFSGDKLLGGPQAGILVGQTEAIDRCRAHPLARATRLGRMPLAALAATLALYRDPARARAEIPVLAMLEVSREELDRRAEKLAAITGGEIIESTARVGGGTLPLTELPGPAVAISVPTGPAGDHAEHQAARLRAQDPPLITRIVEGRVIVDPRTLPDGDLELAAATINAALAPPPPPGTAPGTDPRI